MLVRTWLQGPRHGIVVRDMSRTIVPRQNRQEEFPGAAIFPRVSVSGLPCVSGIFQTAATYGPAPVAGVTSRASATNRCGVATGR